MFMSTCPRQLVLPCIVLTYITASRISVSIFVSFIARALSTIKGDLFCYSAISSAGVVHILPGFTIRKLQVTFVLVYSIKTWHVVVSALELTSRNIICGSVRMVYAVIYTLFLVGRHHLLLRSWGDKMTYYLLSGFQLNHRIRFIPPRRPTRSSGIPASNASQTVLFPRSLDANEWYFCWYVCDGNVWIRQFDNRRYAPYLQRCVSAS
jgi:hypothetical protein